MKSRVTGRIAAVAGGAAILAMGVLSGCSPTTEKDAPSSTSVTPSSSAPAPTATPTEKALGPGDNSFSPSVNPVPPGAVCKQIVNGVCVR
ncbi:MAG: hypothetical protein ACR2JM_01660 [Mycobacterium sp.]